MTILTLTNPNIGRLADNIISSGARHLPNVTPQRHANRRGAVVCGTAPSLLKPSTLRKIRELVRRKWVVIAVKDAVRLLWDRKIPVDYSVAIDPDARQIEKTHLDPRVTYCLASSCSPVMFDHVINGGCKVEVYHSACGAPDECGLYRKHHGYDDVAQGGYTVVNRAVSLAEYMGVPRIVVAGADFGWREGSEYYAAGCVGRPGNEQGALFCDDGKIEGDPKRVWYSRLDLLASAVDIARRAKAGKVKVIGDSLAASLSKFSEADLDRVVKMAPPPTGSVPAEQKSGPDIGAMIRAAQAA